MTYLKFKPMFGNRVLGDTEFSLFDPTTWPGGIADLLSTPVDASDPSVASMNLTVTASGTGSISTADFVSVSGVCKPQNFPALTFAQDLQRQLNRVAQAKNFGKISTDGAIGAATLALFRKVQAAAPATTIMGDASSCVLIAGDSDVLAQQVKAFADSLGAPAVVAGPMFGTSTGHIVTKTGVKVSPPGASASILDSFGAMDGTQKLVFGGLAVGIGYMLLKPKKGGRK